MFLFPPSAASQLPTHANRRNLPPPPPQPQQQYRCTTPPPPPLPFARQPNAGIGALCFWSLAALLLLLPPPLALGQKLSDDGLFYCSMPESNLAVSYCGGDYPSRTSASLGPPDDKVFAMLDKRAAAATKTLVASYGCNEEQCKVARAPQRPSTAPFTPFTHALALAFIYLFLACFSFALLFRCRAYIYELTLRRV
jgi:hypothetical protein